MLTPRNPDLEVRDSPLVRSVLSLDKELYSTLSLFTQVYKWVPVTFCGGNSAMDQHPVQGEVAILLGMFHAKKTGISPSRLGLWLKCAFIVFYLLPGYIVFS